MPRDKDLDLSLWPLENVGIITFCNPFEPIYRPGGRGGTQVCKTLEFFPCFCSHFLCLPSHFLHFRRIFYDFYCTFPAFSPYLIRFLLLHFSFHFLRLMLFSCIFSYVGSHFLCLPSHSLPFHNSFLLHLSLYFLRFALFSAFSNVFAFISSAYPHTSCIFVISSTLFIASLFSSFPAFDAIFLHFPIFLFSFPLPTITFPAFSRYFLRFLLYHPAVLGGLDAPPSTNCLVVHNPAKRSIYTPFFQPESEIWNCFVNHSPHTPYSHFVRKQQLAS